LIDHLRVGATANFFRLKRRLSSAAVSELFRDLRKVARSPSRNLFRHERERMGGAVWSAVAFFEGRDPIFLRPPPPDQSERTCGYLLLVEHRSHVAVFKSGLELPAGFKSEYFERVPYERVEAATAQEDAVFEKIRLRNMSPSKLVLRAKTLEAGDLSNSVGPAGASRYAPQSYATRRAGDRFSVTPNTGRISQRVDTGGHAEAIGWACRIIDNLLDAAGQTAAFIRTFARSVDLRSVAASLQPRSFVVNAAAIADILFEDRSHRLVRKNGDDWIELEPADAGAVVEALDQVLPVRIVRKEWRLFEGDQRTHAGLLRLNATRISLRVLDRGILNGLFVERTNYAVGDDPERTSLRTFIDQNDHFMVLFDEASLAYLFGTLYRDDAFAAGNDTLLRHLKPDARLSTATDEKGTFAAPQTAFDADSVFGIIVDGIAVTDQTLVCDDLGDEWADFIGLNARGEVPVLSFYHAKHGDLSLGASPFHIAVSQAIKNLGRLSLPSEIMDRKIESWTNFYSGDGVQTQIPRVLRGGDAAALAHSFREARLAPNLVKRVCIVTSSLSRQRVSDSLARIRAGHAPEAHFVQLYWLLLSFFSACAEVGAVGTIICQN
jgi:hypothetical protein